MATMELLNFFRGSFKLENLGVGGWYSRCASNTNFQGRVEDMKDNSIAIGLPKGRTTNFYKPLNFAIEC